MSKLLWTMYFKLIALPVHATSPDATNTEDIVNSITNVITDVIDKVKAVATPIAVLCVSFCGIKLLIASDPQAVKSAKSWLFTIVIALMVLYLANPLISTVTSIFN